VIGDFAKLPEHAAVADQLQQAISSTVYEQLAAGLPAMEQHADLTLEILELVSRALRRFPHLPQTPTFQVSLQFALVSSSSPNDLFVPPNLIFTDVQVSITSRNERILDGAFHFLSTCLQQPSVAPTLVQLYGRQILAELLPRIKGVYPKKVMRDVAPLLQKMFAQDMEGVPSIALSILHQVRSSAFCLRLIAST
jgi:hypothetical protein